MRLEPSTTRRTWLAAVGLLVLVPSWTLAQHSADRPASAIPPGGTRAESTSPPPQGVGGPVQNSPTVGEQHRLPPDSVTKQSVSLPDRTLNFTATAGSIRLFNDKGDPEADV